MIVSCQSLAMKPCRFYRQRLSSARSAKTVPKSAKQDYDHG
jgi:hypothetical protein